MDEKKKINFRFCKGWEVFLKWFESHKTTPIWEIQEKKISEIFEHNAPNIVDWKVLWKEFRVWYKEVYDKNGNVLWQEQRRQSETLMLEQLKELNKEQFVLVFLHNGKPEISMEKISYWEALHLKEKLDGDSNGVGGNENMEKITIVNLNKLIK